jgi:hypothetical protein
MRSPRQEGRVRKTRISEYRQKRRWKGRWNPYSAFANAPVPPATTGGVTDNARGCTGRKVHDDAGNDDRATINTMMTGPTIAATKLETNR